MSKESAIKVRRRYWISLALLFTLFHYCEYLWPFIYDISTNMSGNDEANSIDRVLVVLLFLATTSIVALGFSFYQLKYWRAITITISLIGIFSGETIIVLRNFEFVYSKWYIFIDFLMFVGMVSRNAIFVPLLYLAVIILVIQDWMLVRNE